MDTQDNEDLYRSQLDDKDLDGEKLNEDDDDVSGEDLDVPGEEDDDAMKKLVKKTKRIMSIVWAIINRINYSIKKASHLLLAFLFYANRNPNYKR